MLCDIALICTSLNIYTFNQLNSYISLMFVYCANFPRMRSRAMMCQKFAGTLRVIITIGIQNYHHNQSVTSTQVRRRLRDNVEYQWHQSPIICFSILICCPPFNVVYNYACTVHVQQSSICAITIIVVRFFLNMLVRVVSARKLRFSYMESLPQIIYMRLFVNSQFSPCLDESRAATTAHHHHHGMMI